MVDLTSTYLRPRLEWCKRNHLAIEASIHIATRNIKSLSKYGCVFSCWLGLASIDTLVVVVKIVKWIYESRIGVNSLKAMQLLSTTWHGTLDLF